MLELSEVSFMDSSGIAALITTRPIAATTLRRSWVTVERLLVLTRLTDTLDVE